MANPAIGCTELARTVFDVTQNRPPQPSRSTPQPETLRPTTTPNNPNPITHPL